MLYGGLANWNACTGMSFFINCGLYHRPLVCTRPHKKHHWPRRKPRTQAPMWLLQGLGPCARPWGHFASAHARCIYAGGHTAPRRWAILLTGMLRGKFPAVLASGAASSGVLHLRPWPHRHCRRLVPSSARLVHKLSCGGVLSRRSSKTVLLRCFFLLALLAVWAHLWTGPCP